ncbi:MAG: hypothetical protein AAFV53_11690 [Myxococcota bacterium]
MANEWPYDESTRTMVANQMVALLPAMLRVQDRETQQPGRPGDLERLLRVLAAPMAGIRQNIEELHADLFIDTCGEEAIALLAEMVGTRLIFPDEQSNRLDVRGTVGWRRAKGTPPNLENMAEDLLGQLSVMVEGWKRVQMAQDLNLRRMERVVPDVRAAVLAEQATGPLDATFHAVDLRAITSRSGRYHPRHVAHWFHPTRAFPVQDGTPCYAGGDPAWEPNAGVVGGVTDPDWRYAFHPYRTPDAPFSRMIPLRARRTSPDDPIITDRIPPMHFAIRPGDWFDQDGRFTVRVCGLPAAVGAPQEGRVGIREPADRIAVDGPARLTVLTSTSDGVTVPIQVTVCAVTFDPLTGMPDTAGGAEERVSIEVDAAGGRNATSITTTPVGTGRVVMIRLEPLGAAGALLPETVLTLTGGTPEAARSSTVGSLVDEGFLRGALTIRIPRTWVLQRHWLYLAADGSVAPARSANAVGLDADIPLDVTATPRLPADGLVAGPGPAWPPLPLSASTERITSLPGAFGRGPAVLHGGRTLTTTGALAAGASVSLVFAACYTELGHQKYRPFTRLRWTGADPVPGSWTVLEDDGTVAASPFARLERLRRWALHDGPTRLRLAVRLESDLDGVIFTPAEVAWSDWSGQSVLIHLPELTATAGAAAPLWNTPGLWSAHSEIVTVAEDGTTWWGTGVARKAVGGIAPLSAPTVHLRRRIRWRSLCPWRAEPGSGTPHAGCAAGWLEVDPGHGLFAFALSEPPQPWSADASGVRAPNVSVVWQEGYTAHIGARSAAREPALNIRQPTPTRVVSRSGVLSSADALPAGVTVHHSLAEAFAAIDASTDPIQPEVIRLEDSATYPEASLAWPVRCASLTIQAAERHRPIVVADAWSPPGLARYAELTLRGVVWSGADVPFPPIIDLTVQYCSGHAGRWQIPGGDEVTVNIDHCLLPGLQLVGAGTLTAMDSVIDASGGVALSAVRDTLKLERCTVMGTTECMVLHASECVFTDVVMATDPFHGCVRYSSVPPASSLPRRYRVHVGAPPRLVSSSRHDPGHARLAANSRDEIRFGAEDGDEMGAFHEVQAARRQEALLRRLAEYTPAGLRTGLIRVD